MAPKVARPQIPASAWYTVSSRPSVPTEDATPSNPPRSCNPGASEFEPTVLSPRGIRIQILLASVSAFNHFQIVEPSHEAGRRKYYQRDERLQHSRIWLDANDDFVNGILNEYRCMVALQLPEAEFAAEAFQKLLFQDPRQLICYTERTFVPARALKRVLKPQSELWAAPPLLQTMLEPREDYAFDIQPDCMYWISLQAFNPEYREAVAGYVHVNDLTEGLLCPYLTVEFSEDAAGSVKASQKIAVAGSLALYNRYMLRKKRLEQCGLDSTSDAYRDIRHYGILFQAAYYEVWIVRPDIQEGSWQGCTMSRLYFAKLDMGAPQVRKLIDWLNEIHRWAITEHGPACKLDVKTVLQHARNGVTTSLMDEEESTRQSLEDL